MKNDTRTVGGGGGEEKGRYVEMVEVAKDRRIDVSHTHTVETHVTELNKENNEC